MREYTAKVDKLEQSDAVRSEEEQKATEKPLVFNEPQLMLTAGPSAMGMPGYGGGGVYGIPGGYAGAMPGYGVPM